MPPEACSQAALARFATLVATAGEVAPDGLLGRIRRAHRLAFLGRGGDVVGVAALKVPNEDYRETVFANAEAGADPDEFGLELGWLVVTPEQRGQGFAAQLVRAVLADLTVPVFATAAADNARVARINQQVGLLPTGCVYRGCSGRPLRLFTRWTVLPT